MSKGLNEFIDNFHDWKDRVQTEVDGELLEAASDNFTYMYGNGELIVSPDDDNLDSEVWVLESWNGIDYKFEQVE